MDVRHGKIAEDYFSKTPQPKENASRAVGVARMQFRDAAYEFVGACIKGRKPYNAWEEKVFSKSIDLLRQIGLDSPEDQSAKVIELALLECLTSQDTKGIMDEPLTRLLQAADILWVCLFVHAVAYA